VHFKVFAKKIDNPAYLTKVNLVHTFLTRPLPAQTEDTQETVRLKVFGKLF